VGQTPAWVRWRDVAAGWFDLSSRNLKWQIAGATGVAFAILIAALGVQSLRQASKPDRMALAEKTSEAVRMEPNAIAPTPEPSPSNEQFSDGGGLSGYRLAPLQVPVPAPVVGPSPGDPPVPMAPSTESTKLYANQPNGQFPFNFNATQNAPVISKREDAAADAEQRRGYFQGGQGLRQGANAAVMESADSAQQTAQTRLGNLGRTQAPGSAVQSQKEIGPRITPPSDINPMNSEQPSLAPPDKPQPEKRQNEKSSRVAKVVEIAKDILIPVPLGKPDPKKEAKTLFGTVKPTPKAEAREKPKPPDDDRPGVEKRIRDKSFVFRRDKNMWIDEAYKEETMLFRASRLWRGSKEYEDVLAKDPQLKEFFDLGQIIIVWKNKVYRVVDKPPDR